MDVVSKISWPMLIVKLLVPFFLSNLVPLCLLVVIKVFIMKVFIATHIVS